MKVLVKLTVCIYCRYLYRVYGTHTCKRKLKVHSRMANPEKQAALKIRHRTKTKSNTKGTTQKTKRMSTKSHPKDLGLAQVLGNSTRFFFADNHLIENCSVTEQHLC
jgi:hypothetical protein